MAATVQGILLTGDHASRPSSGVSTGTIYACSTHYAIEQTTDNGGTWVTWPGLGTTAPNPTTIELGHASDTTLARASAGNITVEGNAIYRAGGTDVPVADGGTGSSTAAGAATNLGLGTGDSPQFTAINVGHASDTTIARASAGNLTVEGNALYRAGGTDVALADGGTGVSLTDPNADRIMFWDDSAGGVDWLTAGSGLSISGTTITASGSGGALVDTDTQTLSSGNLTLNSATWANVSTGTDLVVNASTGDLLQVSMNGRLAAGGANTHTVFDIASIVSASPVNYFGTAGGASDEGLNGLYSRDTIDSALSGSFNYTVQAGDISGGTVTLRLRYRQPSSTGNRTFVAGSVNPFKWWVINLGQ